MRLVVVLLALSCICVTYSVIVGAIVAPHGAVAFDPGYIPWINATHKEWAYALNKALLDVGKLTVSLEPDIIFLSTPHGVAASKDYTMYNNNDGYGNADQTEGKYTFKGYPNIKQPIDIEITNKLVESMGLKNFPVSEITAFAEGESMPLRWGEVIPLSFMNTKKYNPSLDHVARTVIFSQPRRRIKLNGLPMINELLRLGSSLAEELHAMKERVVICISGDLAHTHDKDGPFGFSDEAEPYDEAIMNWLSSLDSRHLIGTNADDKEYYDDFAVGSAASYVEKAISCGFTGFVMLQGIINQVGREWTSHIMAGPYHPTYYGMIVASMY
mmetsp:Transcript_1246/g.1413  ORF Transcript_1246/g.1413 Transcript_1246/m.1413 type:complete len:328 (+) Transcript_1246:1-984(+)